MAVRLVECVPPFQVYRPEGGSVVAKFVPPPKPPPLVTDINWEIQRKFEARLPMLSVVRTFQESAASFQDPPPPISRVVVLLK